ncbi:phospholipase D/nuclease [Gonapodya prolifera JEL478]|uniref:phospholipase D n=1 Tax=Gonapodya prolifera (strain JEL478) TaxID=1344416 RepID=A0A139AQV0_GONPJ|nr:phospholipase D/nuclease [Gonapodya prolifera JEL478]|eukprot:KXS19116.1 phospholipase D/nuclease [Gonapodya prolifera JEL478]
MDKLFKKIEQKVERLEQKVEHKLAEKIPDIFGKKEDRVDKKHSHTHLGYDCNSLHPGSNRYESFAPESSGLAKWHVDGASYFWALSESLEEARESIYIMDWWLSPELYLRRPPSQNGRYRLDTMLKAAAERGVQVRVMVYKEVPQALTLNSEHTKHALEALHPNIKVFRHPEHVITGSSVVSEVTTGIHNAFTLARMPADRLKILFGTINDDDTVLFWAHHEKLCIIDRRIVFMGGLDACFGRWDTTSHPIADFHPNNPNDLIFPGQDYNNARVYDFEGVDKWDHNKLDRSLIPRMGWSDISISMSGPIVDSLLAHFVSRWDFIYGQKYNTEDGRKKYAPIGNGSQTAAAAETHGHHGNLLEESRRKAAEALGGLEHHLRKHAPASFPNLPNFMGDSGLEERRANIRGAMDIQLIRSSCNWSHGLSHTEHSIANAYISIINSAEHFIYIENQFFITASDDKQRPVHNKIGAALVSRIIRAYKNGEDFRVIVIMPAVPGFAGDLKADGALGTRGIMEFQYNSICRGGNSILEKLAQAGITRPDKYISFYNLRNYDRIRKQPGNPRFDSVSAASMTGGPDLNAIPWEGNPAEELDSFVSEQLYIHTKVLIADDRRVICGSANLNDRSQLGDHDSEIAVVIEDSANPVNIQVAGRSYTANRFAASLRRYLFRKHLGLLPDQRHDLPDGNFHPINRGLNEYDWDSPADRLVVDPLSPEFDKLWRGTAKTNTEVFSKVFHNVPNDAVRTWKAYEDFFTKYFYFPGSEEEKDITIKAKKVLYGHVVKSEFPGGAPEVKKWLGRVRGSLVEMPLCFLADVKDIAKEGLALNDLTDELYT